MNFLRSHLTTVLAIIVIVLGGAYFLFSDSSKTAPPLTATPSLGAGGGPEQQFLELFNRLELVSFDTSILSDERFRSLSDLATPLTDESAGRVDPFAPFGGASSPQ